MPKTPPYSKEFRAEAVRLLRSSGRSIPQLARKLGCSEQSLRNWSRPVDVDAGDAEGLTTDEREELRRLRRENLILAEERDILKKRRPSSPRTARLGEDLRVYRGEEGRALDQAHVPGPGCQPVWASCLAGAQTVGAGA
jgi:transposase